MSLAKNFASHKVKNQISLSDLFSYKTILRMLRDQKFDVAIVEPFTICGYGTFK